MLHAAWIDILLETGRSGRSAHSTSNPRTSYAGAFTSRVPASLCRVWAVDGGDGFVDRMGTRDMNKWLNRAVVGTVGGVSVAGGMLLLGTGAAHADSVVPTTGTLDNVFRPAPADNLGLSVDTPGSTVSSGMVDEGPL